MVHNPDNPPALLGDALAQALDRTVGTSMDSLQALRIAVRNYTVDQKAHGVALDRVMLALSSVLMQVEDERMWSPDEKGARDPELARQLRAWCSEEYALKRGGA